MGGLGPGKEGSFMENREKLERNVGSAGEGERNSKVQGAGEAGQGIKKEGT